MALSKSHLFTVLTRQSQIDETTERAATDQTRNSGNPEPCFQRWPVRNAQGQRQDNTGGSAPHHTLPAIRKLSTTKGVLEGKVGGGREGEEITLIGQTELELIIRHTQIDYQPTKNW